VKKFIVMFTVLHASFDFLVSHRTHAHAHLITRESSYCFQRVLAIAILSVRLSVTRVDQSKTVQARITKSLPTDRI